MTFACQCLSYHYYWPSILGPVHHVVDRVFIRHKVNPQQAGVAVGQLEGLEAVTQFMLHCQTSQAAAQMLQERGRKVCSAHNQDQISTAPALVLRQQCLQKNLNKMKKKLWKTLFHHNPTLKRDMKTLIYSQTRYKLQNKYLSVLVYINYISNCTSAQGGKLQV